MSIRTAILLLSAISLSAAHAETRKAVPPPVVRDGQRDFDFLVGKWSVTLKKLDKPLTGSTTWIEGKGTSTCRHIWGGEANIDELEIEMPTGKIQATTIRLYDPTSHQWYLYWASSRSPKIEIPTIGEWKDGVGTFYDHEVWNGRAILVRYQWSKVTPKSAYFEQAFSTDGGQTWETNWITQLVRIE
jgi:hypothetical protein